MNDHSFSAPAIRQAGDRVDAAAEPLRGALARITTPPSDALGELMATATAFTYPAASDGARHFIEALLKGTGEIADTLRDNATRYETTERENIERARSVLDRATPIGEPPAAPAKRPGPISPRGL